MSTETRSGSLATWILALGAALTLGAQAIPGSGDENMPEASPVFKGLVPGLSNLPLVAPSSPSGKTGEESASPLRLVEEERMAQELKRLKEKDRVGGIARFADDLFELRQSSPSTTDGGVSEDYVLGTGDRLQLHVYGSTPMGTALEVDGRGMVNIPRVGSLRVAGMPLAKAKMAVQALVNQNFARSKSELQVIRLREVRVAILGEVYQPGSYLVSSLASLVNVLGLAGGPTSRGSLRQIRVMRGGQTVFELDLYPLRAEGKGNPNFTLQSGDVVFVPLAKCMVTLEGAFLRLGGASPLTLEDGEDETTDQRQAESQQGRGAKKKKAAAEDTWFAPNGGEPPRMAFELLPGEGIPALMDLVGGLLPEWSSGVLSLRRSTESGAVELRTLSAKDPGLGAITLQRGDVLSALPRRERDDTMITLSGWVRVQGQFARTEGLRIGALLKRDQQVLPDSYTARGEIIRTAPDGTLKFLVFSVEEALKGNPAHDLLLENRDQIKIYPASALRITEHVTVVGPVAHPGTFRFVQGMRASDLVFLSGVPQKRANRLIVELARTGKGKPSTVKRLDLTALLSSDSSSPVDLKDDVRNPVLEADDQLSFFETPGFKVHRVVKISGQVALPGSFVLDEQHFTLRELITRAGGFTPEAMPAAGILLRHIEGSVGNREKNSAVAPVSRGVDEILDRLSEVKRQPNTGQLLRTPILHGLAEGKLNRMVVDFKAAAQGDPKFDVELQDGDEIIIPQVTQAAFVVGETASPFGTYKVLPGMKVRQLLDLAGGTTRNADTWNLRLLRANGQILDHGVKGLVVEPGDTILVPQRIQRDSSWQENLAALTPVALILNAIWR